MPPAPSRHEPICNDLFDKHVQNRTRDNLELWIILFLWISHTTINRSVHLRIGQHTTPEVTSKMILHFLKGRGERSLTWYHSISLISYITKTATYMMKRHIYCSCDYQYTTRRFCEGTMHDPICLNKFAFSFLFPITVVKSIRSKLPWWYCSDSI